MDHFFKDNKSNYSKFCFRSFYLVTTFFSDMNMKGGHNQEPTTEDEQFATSALESYDLNNDGELDMSELTKMSAHMRKQDEESSSSDPDLVATQESTIDNQINTDVTSVDTDTDNSIQTDPVNNLNTDSDIMTSETSADPVPDPAADPAANPAAADANAAAADAAAADAAAAAAADANAVLLLMLMLLLLLLLILLLI